MMRANPQAEEPEMPSIYRTTGPRFFVFYFCLKKDQLWKYLFQIRSKKHQQALYFCLLSISTFPLNQTLEL